jgi:hypothetical protein
MEVDKSPELEKQVEYRFGMSSAIVLCMSSLMGRKQDKTI